MGSQLLISVSPWDDRVALTEQGRLVEFYLEQRRAPDLTGNIYKGVVVRVLPGMDAAFVDIGLNRPGYLNVEEISGQQGGFYDLWLENEASQPAYPMASPAPPISDLLREGQELLVQVSRPPLGSKGARLTTHITLPGHYLVYAPTLTHSGISRRITDQSERERLQKLLARLKPQEGGLIARTASFGQSEAVLKQERDSLASLWQKISKKQATVRGPALLREDLDFVRRMVRELCGPDLDRVVIDDAPAYEKVLEYVSRFDPRLKNRVEFYDGTEPLFAHFGLEASWPRLLSPKVWLKSGGYLIINATEALTAIDVNTGRFIGSHQLENTIVKTNLEASQEIARQLRLRNIAGLIVIDFIDMKQAAHREEVYRAFIESLKADRAKITVVPISPLGLVEMTRERLRESLAEQLTEPCECCGGSGRRFSPLVGAHDILRQLLSEAREFPGCRFTIRAHPEVAALVLSEGQEILSRLEQEQHCHIEVKEEYFPLSGKYEIVRDLGS
ncbi:MAG: Rne/Rng family ribonuclease [Deltaproteobacteria bacterium]|nr:Rne/Rng family ribonuclease [Deltaproteobacteria bacterium]